MTCATDALVLFSGGIDSTACAHFLLGKGYRVSALFVDYGQKAATAESTAAKELSSMLGITLQTMTLVGQQSYGAGEITGRNAFLVFSAMLGGFCVGTGSIALGIHSGTPYYDCTPAFVSAIDRLVGEYTDGRRRVIAPFLLFTKRDILHYYIKQGLPLEKAYSCEAGEIPPCGTCLSCLDRKQSA